MWEATFEAALNNGLWAALFVALMIYILRDTAKRERKYQNVTQENQRIINQLAEDLRIVKDIRKDINDIKGELRIGKVKKQKRVAQRAVNSNTVGGFVPDQCRNDACPDDNGSNSGNGCSVDNSRDNNQAATGG